ncbi:MAG: SDR family NAD(P)-dependent oxidoreductase [Gammaproteobacteria bacterium]|nr:SDR family NAD(P)-dependent oxidoreductase [Gammaproteobacteria bacterium]
MTSRSPDNPITRRQLLQGAAALPVATTVAACGGGEVERPPGVPLSPYGADSTAEEVTAGLSLAGRTALVTGANSGLGFETMRVLALRGARVFGTARTLDKAREACARAQGETTPLALELTDFDSVVACAGEVAGSGAALDMLILNAGVMELPALEQVYGLEKHFVTNHLGHFLLTMRLLPQVQAAAQGRVVVVSSGSSYREAPEVGIEFDNLSGERGYEPIRAYGHSKLANVLFARALSKRLAGTAATANSLQPGVIMTNLGRHLPWYQIVTAKLFGWAFMKTVEAGAATQVHVATDPGLSATSGHFFRDCNAIVPPGHLGDDAMAQRLWTVSEELTQRWLA